MIADKGCIDSIIRKEIQRANSSEDMFLQQGLAGISLFLFLLYKKTGNSRYHNEVYGILDIICQNLKTSDVLEIPKGLTGVSLSLMYLVTEGYVDGNISNILKNIDDHIYKTVVCEIDNPKVKDFHKYESSLLDIIVYTAIRLKKTEMDSVERNIRERFLLLMIDRLYLNHNSDFYKEPFPGSLHYKIPKFLIAISLASQIEYCRKRVCHVLEECEHRILAQLPYLGYNRLFLYASVKYLEKNFELNARWQQYKDILRDSINVRQIMDDEIPDNDLFFSKGLTGIYFFMTKVTTDIGSPEDRELIAKRIEMSDLFLRPTEALIDLYDFHGLDGVLSLILYMQIKVGDEKKN